MLIQIDDDVLVQKYSDELANGDSADNREIHEEEDVKDLVVDYNGHTNRGYGSSLPKDFFDRNHILPGHRITVPKGEDQLGNNIAALSQEPYPGVWSHDDVNNDVGTLPGQTNRGYASKLPKEFFAGNHILPGHRITVPRDEYRITTQNNSHMLAQGEPYPGAWGHDDINSDVGTLPGQTNRGYGSKLPKEYFEGNHILSGHRITVPRDESDLGNNVARAQVEPTLTYPGAWSGGDINSDIGTLPGQTNRGYGSKLPKDFFDGNHILPGHRITVPRDEAGHGLENNIHRLNSNSLAQEPYPGVWSHDDVNNDVGTLPG